MIRDCIHCGDAGFKKIGVSSYCRLHWKIINMRTCARRRGKSDPGREAIERMFSENSEMVCRCCSRKMKMYADGTDNASVISMQHWDDGSVSLVCMSCNIRHRSIGDKRFSLLDTNTRTCYVCKEIFPLKEFYSGGRGFGGTNSKCKKCSSEQAREYWKRKKSQLQVRGPS